MSKKKPERVSLIRMGALNIPVIHDESMEDCGQYKSVEGPTVYTGPPALEPGTAEYATTVFHEMLHAISDLYGLNLSESKVRVLEQTIAGMFRQNPEWAKLYIESILSPEPKASEEKCPKSTKKPLK